MYDLFKALRDGIVCSAGQMSRERILRTRVFNILEVNSQDDGNTARESSFNSRALLFSSRKKVVEALPGHSAGEPRRPSFEGFSGHMWDQNADQIPILRASVFLLLSH